MKFIISSSKLLKQLQILNSLISNTNSIPIINNFLFEILKEDELKITSTDLNNTLISYIKVITKTLGKVAVPSKLIIDILKTFTDQLLTISFKENKNNFEIITEQGYYLLSVNDCEDFPKPPIFKISNHLKIKTEILIKIINQTLFATSSDELRPVMTGVFFKMGPQGSIFVSTDAHKLVKYFRKDLKTEQITEFIIPKKPLQLLKNILYGEEVIIDHNNINTRFTFDNKILICRLINGTYPNYEVIIPKNNNKIIIINKLEFLNSLKRITLFSNKNTYQVCLQIIENKIYIYAEDINFSNKAKEYINCNYKGEKIKIGFNSKFLIEMISHLKNKNIIFKISHSNCAIIIKPLEQQQEFEEIFMLLIPIAL